MKSFFDFLYNLIAGSGNDTQYASIPTKPLIEVDESSVEISEALRGDDVPHLGDNHEYLLRRAMILYPTDSVRIKWLQSLQVVRSTKVGWALDGEVKKGGELKGNTPKWGIRSAELAS